MLGFIRAAAGIRGYATWIGILTVPVMLSLTFRIERSPLQNPMPSVLVPNTRIINIGQADRTFIAGVTLARVQVDWPEVQPTFDLPEAFPSPILKGLSGR